MGDILRSILESPSHAALNYGRKLADLPPLPFIPSEVLRERNSQYSFAQSV